MKYKQELEIKRKNIPNLSIIPIPNSFDKNYVNNYIRYYPEEFQIINYIIM